MSENNLGKTREDMTPGEGLGESKIDSDMEGGKLALGPSRTKATRRKKPIRDLISARDRASMKKRAQPAHPKNVLPLDAAHSAFRKGQYNEAARLYTQLIEATGATAQLLDSRAAAYIKTAQLREALLDAKTTIELAPNAAVGYQRAAQILLQLGKFATALEMVDKASQRVKATDTKRRDGIETTRKEILELQRLTACHVGTIPFEILLEVLQYLQQDGPHTALRMGGVCKHWRDVVQRSPILWSKLVLRGSKPERKAALFLKNAQQGGQRSKLRAIDVAGLAAAKLFVSLRTSEQLATITEMAHDAELFNDPLGTTFSLFDLSQLPSLRRLTIRNGTEFAVTEADVARLASLEHLSVQALEIAFAVEPKFDALRTLHLQGVVSTSLINIAVGMDTGHRQVLDMIATAPLLQELHLATTMLSTQPTDVEIELPELRSFEAGPHIRNDLIWSRLQMPNLDRLALSAPVSAYQTLALMRCDPAKLIELRLVGLIDIPAARVAEHLLKMPNLAKLAIIRAEGDITDLVDQISRAGGLSLEDVNFTDCQKLTGGAVVRLVRSRLTTASTEAPQLCQLLSLVLDGCSLVEPTVLPWLRQTVPRMSCVYVTKKQARGARFLG